MSADVVDLAVQLMRIDSTSGREGPVIDAAETILAARGWSIRRIPVNGGRDDLLATRSPQWDVTLSTHLDTVPPFIPPRIEGERLLGRGACDAKGIAAAMICAAEELNRTGVTAALLFVVGEEVSHDGATAANAFPNQSRILIDGEPTESKLATGTKGAMRFTLRTSGVAAHSAYPERGESATLKLAQLLAELPQLRLPSDPVLGETTINIGSISGGVADNVVSPSAEAHLMARTVGDSAELVALLRNWAGKRAEIQRSVTVPPVHLKVVDGIPAAVVSFATDIPALTKWGEPLLFGPGSIHVAHSDGEFVDIPELKSAVRVYADIARKALATLD